jgi:alcohol dehydrogenase (NADP+)
MVEDKLQSSIGNPLSCRFFQIKNLFIMKYLNFSSDSKMPILGLGTWQSEKGEVYQAIRTAINIGYRHFDCAAVYGNEKEIGQALKDAFDAGDVQRSDLWITSKLWNTAHKKGQVKPALEKSLSKLQLDYLDLYLMHWPIAIKEDAPFPFPADGFYTLEEIPLEETWDAMHDCHKAGLIKNIGVANFSVKKIKKLIAATGIKPSANQVEMHPFLPQKDLVDFAQKENIYLTAYSPLGSGGRPGAPDLFSNEILTTVAKKHNCTVAQTLIAWSIKRGISVIPKSVNPKRLEENFNSININLDKADMEQIDHINIAHRFIDGTFFTPEGSPYTLENLWD